MAISCPNVKLKEYKNLVKATGSDALAHALWINFDGEVPAKYYSNIAKDNIIEPTKLPLYRSDPTVKDRLFDGKNEISIEDILDKLIKDSNLGKLAAKLKSKLNDSTRNTIVKLLSASDILKTAKNHGSSREDSPNGLAAGDEIFINESGNFMIGNADKTVLHEVIHIITAEYLETVGSKDFDKLLEYTRSLFPGYDKVGSLSYLYGLTNTHEFMTAIFTDSILIKKLNNAAPMEGVEFNNLWEEIYDFLLGLLKIYKGTTLYDQAFALGTQLIEESSAMEEMKWTSLDGDSFGYEEVSPYDTIEEAKLDLMNTFNTHGKRQQVEIWDEKGNLVKGKRNIIKKTSDGFRITIGRKEENIGNQNITGEEHKRILEGLLEIFEKQNGYELGKIDGYDFKMYNNRVNQFINDKRRRIGLEPNFDIAPDNVNIKEGVDFVFEQNPELVNIGTQGEYSSYLDTIFPNSKVKDILWHGSTKSNSINKFINNNGIYFTDNYDYALSYAGGEGYLPDASYVKTVIINSNKVDDIKEIHHEDVRNYKDNSDTLTGYDVDSPYRSYVVFNPNQIHILGSKQDVQGFKQFKSKDNGLIEAMGREFTAITENIEDIPQDPSTVVNRLASVVPKQAFEVMINKKQQTVNLLKKRLSEGTGRHEEVKAKIHIIEQQIESLEAKATNREVINQAIDDSNMISTKLNSIRENLYTKTLNEKQLQSIITDLHELGGLTKIWLDINHSIGTLESDDAAMVSEVRNLLGLFQDLDRSYLENLKKAFLDYANTSSFKTFSEEELYGVMKDESWWRSNMLGAGMSNIDLIKIVQHEINKATHKIHEETNEKNSELKSQWDKIKTHLGVKTNEEVSKLFFQFNSLGKWTGAFVIRIGQGWFDESNRLADIARKSGDKLDWAKYFKFKADSTIELTKAEYDIRKSNKKFSTGEDVFTEEDFKKQDKLIESFNSHRDAFKQMMLDNKQYLDSNGDFVSQELEDEFNSNLLQWDELNDPWMESQGMRNKSEYKIRDKVIEKYWDKNYQKIQSDPVLKEFYEFMRGRIDDNNKALPYHEKAQFNKLYSVQKTDMEYFSESKGFMNGVALIGDQFKKAFSAEAQSEIENRVVIEGKVYQSVPVGTLRVDLDSADRTADLFKILQSHTDIAIGYKYKSEIEPILTSAQEIIDNVEAGIQVNTATGTTMKKDANRDTVARKGALRQARKRLEYVINAKLYNSAKEAPDVHGKIELSTGEKRGFSIAQTVDTLTKYTYIKALSFPNFMSPAANLGLGAVSNYSYAAAGIEFDTSSLNKGYKMVTMAVSKTVGGKLWKDNLDTTLAWMIKLNVLDDINDMAYEDSSSWDKKLTVLQSKAEFVNQGAAAMAVIIHSKLKDKNGNDVSMFDAYKVEKGKLVWNSELMGGQTQPDLFKLERKIKGTNFRIHGDYESALMAKETAYGRAAMLFKTWIAGTVEHRFGERRFDADLDRWVKGRYVSLYKSSTVDGLELTFKRIAPILLKGIFSKRAFDILTDTDKANLKQDLREFQILVALTATTLLLMSLAKGGDDEDPAYKKTLFLALNLTSRVQSDLFFYMNPNSASQIINNAVPILGTLGNFINIAPAIYDTIIGNGVYKSGPWKDHGKIAMTTIKAFPVVGSAVKMVNLASNVAQRRN